MPSLGVRSPWTRNIQTAIKIWDSPGKFALWITVWRFQGLNLYNRQKISKIFNRHSFMICKQKDSMAFLNWHVVKHQNMKIPCRRSPWLFLFDIAQKLWGLFCIRNILWNYCRESQVCINHLLLPREEDFLGRISIIGLANIFISFSSSNTQFYKSKFQFPKSQALKSVFSFLYNELYWHFWVYFDINLKLYLEKYSKSKKPNLRDA